MDYGNTIERVEAMIQALPSDEQSDARDVVRIARDLAGRRLVGSGREVYPSDLDDQSWLTTLVQGPAPSAKGRPAWDLAAAALADLNVDVSAFQQAIRACVLNLATFGR